MNRNYWWRKGKRGLLRTPIWIIWEFKIDSCKARMYVYLARTSKEMHMKCDMSVCPIQASYVGIQGWCGDNVVALLPHISMRCWAQHLRPDSTVWPCHTYHVWPCQGCQKYSCTVQSIGSLQHILNGRFVMPIVDSGHWQWCEFVDFSPKMFEIIRCDNYLVPLSIHYFYH